MSANNDNAQLKKWDIDLPRRLRRNRRNEAMRGLVRENVVLPQNLILPLFVQEGENNDTPISSMPGCSRLSIDLIIKKCKEAAEVGVGGVALFPVVPDELKDKLATESTNQNGLLQRCIRAIKAEVPQILIIGDVAMDPYSSDGHDGYVDEKLEINNDITIPILAEMALAQAKAGVDVVAPSDMMDGRIKYIRKYLDDHGYTDVAICSYCTKYCSSFYGPFREALDSAPRGGDKKTYQMDPANSQEALLELRLDEQEGADWVMVKPGLPYLDVVRLLRDNTSLPIAIYQVSGEYAMLKAASQAGWLDFDRCILETLLSMRRAGANIIFTYAAIEAARLLRTAK